MSCRTRRSQRRHRSHDRAPAGGRSTRCRRTSRTRSTRHSPFRRASTESGIVRRLRRAPNRVGRRCPMQRDGWSPTHRSPARGMPVAGASRDHRRCSAWTAPRRHSARAAGPRTRMSRARARHAAREKGGRIARPPSHLPRVHAARRSQVELSEVFGSHLLQILLELFRRDVARILRNHRRLLLVIAAAATLCLGVLHLDRREERFLREDRRRETQCDRDAVGGTRVDVKHVLAAQQVQLREIRVVLHLGDLYAAQLGTHAGDQPLAQVVRERPRRTDVVHFHDDALGLRLSDPDRKQPVAALLLQNHYVRARNAVEPQSGHADFNHLLSRSRPIGGTMTRLGRRHVPMSHDARYFCCAAVSTSTFEPIACSLSRAISRSTASGTRCTVFESDLRSFTRYSAPSDWFAKLMSMTLAGCPSAAARLIKRPSPSRKTRFVPTTYSCTNGRTSRDLPPASLSSAGMSISTLKCPEFEITAPSFMAVKCSVRSTSMLPVRVQKMSPIGAASSIVITRYPSITASSAFNGSISVTMTLAPSPRAREATPRPHQP